MVFFLQLKPIAFMGIDNMGIFNGTFSHSSNRKSTIGNGENWTVPVRLIVEKLHNPSRHIQ